MGTNYYLYRKIPKKTKEKLKSLITEECIYDGSLQQALDDFKPIHIGKSSAGWQFCFDHNDWKYYKPSYLSVSVFIKDEIDKGGRLVDEYGDEILVDVFWRMVELKKKGLACEEQEMFSDDEWHLRFSKTTDFC